MRNKVAPLVALAAGSLVSLAGDGPRVLVIGVDGLKPDCIPPASTPAIDRLIAEGSYNDDAQAEDLTFSGPNWASILHGVHRDKHRVFNNEYRPNNLAPYPDFLTRLEAHDPGLVTAKVVAWDPIAIHQPSRADFVEIPENEDEGVTEIAVKMLSGAYDGMPEGPDVLFIHLDEVDGAGHGVGFDTSQPEYLRGIERADGMIGRITDAMRARPGYQRENWLVILVSDHGGSIDKGHSGNTPEKRTMPFLVSGKAAATGRHFPQPRTCDVPATVLTHMGVAIDPSWGIDGVPIGLAPSTRPAAALGVNLLFNGDAEAQRGFADRGIDAYALGWNDPGPAQWTVIRRDTPGIDLPGAAGVGGNLFSGGLADAADMTQTIDLRPLAAAIDRGARFALSATLGAAADSPDAPMLTVTFLGPAGNPLAVAACDRPDPAASSGRAALSPVSAHGTVPRGARTAVVSLSAAKTSGDLLGALADDLSLTLTAD